MEQKIPIYKFLPIKFSNGRKIESLISVCPHCNTPYLKEDVIGTLNNGFKDIFIIDAIGICDECLQESEIFLRLKIEDEMLKQEYIENGIWKARYYMDKKESWLDGILKKYFSNIDNNKD